MDILPTDTPPLDTMVRDLLMLSQRPRLMLDSTMEDMDMVLDLDMLVLDMLDTDMAILPTDTPPLDTMARDLLMLSPRLRLMLDSTMEDMAMVLDMLVLAMPDLDTLDTDMAILPTDTPPLDTMARGLLMLSLRLRLMLVFTMVDMDMVLDILVLAMPDLDMLDLDMLDLDMLPLPTDTPPLDTMARDLLMLSPRLRLMLVFTMVDMDMVLDIPDSAMLDTDMDILPTDTLPLDTMARGLLMLSQRLRLMLVFTMVDMDMVLAILVLAMLVTDIHI